VYVNFPLGEIVGCVLNSELLSLVTVKKSVACVVDSFGPGLIKVAKFSTF